MNLGVFVCFIVEFHLAIAELKIDVFYRPRIKALYQLELDVRQTHF